MNALAQICQGDGWGQYYIMNIGDRGLTHHILVGRPNDHFCLFWIYYIYAMTVYETGGIDKHVHDIDTLPRNGRDILESII